MPEISKPIPRMFTGFMGVPKTIHAIMAAQIKVVAYIGYNTVKEPPFLNAATNGIITAI